MNFTSPTLDACLSECDLSAPGAREPKDLKVSVFIVDAYGVGSDSVQVVRVFPMVAGVIEKAKRHTAFRQKLGMVLASLANFEARVLYPGIVCRCSQRRPVKDFATRTFFLVSPENLEIFAISIPFYDIPEHFTKSQQAAGSPLFAEKLQQLFNTKVQSRIFKFCARCEKGAKESKLRFCSRCKVAAYCSEECQRAHWKEHKKECTPITEQNVPRNIK
jgi:hypothetical protein